MTTPPKTLPEMIVVYGSLRAGTTMLRLMLDGHPELNCPDETDFLFDYLQINAAGEVTLDLDALRRDRIFRAALGDVTDQGDPRATVEHMMARLAEQGSGTLVLMLHRGIGTLRRLYPDMKIVHMLRDPRDVARSSIGMGWAGNVYCGASHWIETETEWEQTMARADSATARVFDLRYETLVATPEPTLQALCTFLEIPWTPHMLAYEGHSTYDRPDTTLIEQWKRKQTPQDIALVEGRVGALLTARGYAPSGVPPLTPGPLLRTRLELQSRISNWRLRIARYGLRDSLLLAFARRTGFEALADRARDRADAKHQAYLK